MFEQQKSAPWYKSRLLLFAIPVALILIASGFAIYMWMRSHSRDSHDAELEAHRAQQAAQATTAAAPAPPAGPGGQPSGIASPANPAEAAAQAQHAAAARNYWTNFRGPKRDGK